VQWEGDLIPVDDSRTSADGLMHVLAYGPLERQGFGLMLRVFGDQDQRMSRMLEVLADHITRQFPGDCLVGTTIIPGREWENWLAREQDSRRNR